MNAAKDLSVTSLMDDLRTINYIADRGLATSLYISMVLGRPLLLEGEVGVGKTELAKAIATLLNRKLIRLQCYEGIDTSQALYEWDYARQMLQIRAQSDSNSHEKKIQELFGPEFLIERPLLEAVRAGDQCVLLIDEIDRADDEFEAFLLELLSDFQITIPEIGTIKATSKPIVILTSNRTRELHDALKRRCLYSWMGFPTIEREIEIVRARIPSVSEELAFKVISVISQLREMELDKSPGVAESIDWIQSLQAVGAEELTLENATQTLGAIIKNKEDLELTIDALKVII